MSFDPLLEDLAARRRAALKMGSEKRLAERAAAGILNARQRIEYLLDAGSFRELGLLATAIRPEVRNKCPADGKISGFGSIADRPLALVSNDFTSLGASSSVVNGKKIRHAKELATRHGMPLILLGESSGARLPDRMGAQGRATMGSDPAEYLRDRTTPWLSALLGSCYGSSTWYACLSDIVVMRKGATMSVASGRVTKVAVGQPVEAEELGGWRMHATTTGLVAGLAARLGAAHHHHHAQELRPGLPEHGRRPQQRHLSRLADRGFWLYGPRHRRQRAARRQGKGGAGALPRACLGNPEGERPLATRRPLREPFRHRPAGDATVRQRCAAHLQRWPKQPWLRLCA